MSDLFNLIRLANAIVSADDVRQRAATVSQQPWPEDGSLPIAAHVPLYTDPDTGEQDVLWTGSAYGVTAACQTRGAIGPLRVRPTLEMDGKHPVLHVRLVDDEGRTWAHTMDWAGWWSA